MKVFTSLINQETFFSRMASIVTTKRIVCNSIALKRTAKVSQHNEEKESAIESNFQQYSHIDIKSQRLSHEKHKTLKREILNASSMFFFVCFRARPDGKSIDRCFCSQMSTQCCESEARKYLCHCAMCDDHLIELFSDFSAF